MMDCVGSANKKCLEKNLKAKNATLHIYAFVSLYPDYTVGMGI